MSWGGKLLALGLKSEAGVAREMGVTVLELTSPSSNFPPERRTGGTGGVGSLQPGEEQVSFFSVHLPTPSWVISCGLGSQAQGKQGPAQGGHGEGITEGEHLSRNPKKCGRENVFVQEEKFQAKGKKNE